MEGEETFGLAKQAPGSLLEPAFETLRIELTELFS